MIKTVLLLTPQWTLSHKRVGCSRFMTESPRYAPMIQWLEQERKTALGKAFSMKSVKTPPDSETEQEINFPQQSNDELLIAVNRLNHNLEKGIKADHKRLRRLYFT